MHVDPLSVGTLEGKRLARALRHARGCSVCRGPVERVLLATRTLERGTPWEPTAAELDVASESALPVALDAGRARRRWAWVGASVAVAAAAMVVLVLVRPPEFAARGGGEGRAVLRMFCAPAGAEPRELPSGGRCPAGGKLAFAAAAAPGLSSVAVRLAGADGTRLLGPFPVTGRPGAESPLDATPLLAAPGEVEVTAAFAATPEEASAALAGNAVPGAVVFRQRLVAEGPR